MAYVADCRQGVFQGFSGFPVFFEVFAGFWSPTPKLGTNMGLNVDGGLGAPLRLTGWNPMPETHASDFEDGICCLLWL